MCSLSAVWVRLRMYIDSGHRAGSLLTPCKTPVVRTAITQPTAVLSSNGAPSTRTSACRSRRPAAHTPEAFVFSGTCGARARFDLERLDTHNSCAALNPPAAAKGLRWTCLLQTHLAHRCRWINARRSTRMRSSARSSTILFYMQGKFPALATKRDYYLALAYVVRDRLLQRWVSTAAAYTKQRSRTVAYLSAEFLIGPHLGNNLVNLGIYHEVKQAIAELGLDFDDLLQQEEEPGLGNGGLGRLAACFLDSMATLADPDASVTASATSSASSSRRSSTAGKSSAPTNGCAIGTPWDVARPEWAVEVKLGGRTEHWDDEQGRSRALGPRARRHRRAVRHADPRLPHQHRQHAAPVARRSARVVRLRGVQSRRLLRRGQQEDRVGEPDQGPLPERRSDPGQGAAARAAVFLRVAARCRTCCASCAARASRSSAFTRSSRCS